MKLYDANGVEFHIKGVNRGHFDSPSDSSIAKTKANAERSTLWWASGETASNYVTRFTTNYYNNSIVAIPGYWWNVGSPPAVGTQTSGNTDPNLLATVVSDWISQASAWKTIEKWSIINIANEWGPANSTVWRDSYITAISRMRAAGYLGTLMIDAGNWGQDKDDIINYGQAVFNSDPQKNIIFSIHFYQLASNPPSIELTQLKNTGLPIVVGEFGPGRNIGPSPTLVTPLLIMTDADSLGIGWMAWSWDDYNLGGGLSDDNGFALAFNPGVYNSSSDLTTYGKVVVEDASHGLKTNAVPASIFR